MAATIIISIILLAVLVLAIRKLIKFKRSSKCSCGHFCGGCTGCGAERKDDDKTN